MQSKKEMNMLITKQPHRYREQISDYQSGEGVGRGIRGETGCVVQHREYSQHVIITLSGVQFIKT